MKKQIITTLIEAFKRGNKVLICGNGGSASMSNHMAAEFVCSFEHPRPPLPAISLTSNNSILTAWSNDMSFDTVFGRQVWALGKDKDILITISTSGKSVNCLKAAELAKEMGLIVIDFPRKGKTTAKIQEYQLKLMHDIVREVEKAFLV